MRRGTTPTLTIEALNVDLTSFQNMVLIRQGNYLIKRKKVVAETDATYPNQFICSGAFWKNAGVLGNSYAVPYQVYGIITE